MFQRWWMVAGVSATLVSLVGCANEPEQSEHNPTAAPEMEPQTPVVAKEVRREEGKVGKKDARMGKVRGDRLQMNKQQLDKEIAEEAGVLGTLGTTAGGDGGELATLLGTSGVRDGIGGLIGAEGQQIGSGGLGSRGSGLGGGGSADGIVGLGTKGRGSGASGYGVGTGTFGRMRGDDSARVVHGAPMSGDEYKVIEENALQTVADNPLSTFSVDVDTASYTNVRRYLQEGSAPPRDAVRIEEMLNYFPYSYAPPTGNVPFATHAEVTETPWAAGHRLVRIGIKGRDIAANATPPRNLVFLVDVSGSMAGSDRLPLVQRGLTMLAEQLGPEDHVSLVVYAGAAGVVLQPTRGDHTATITDAIGRLRAGGSTAGAAGIRAAYDLAQENFRAGSINRVILATDGDFNVGTNSDAELVQLIEEKRKTGVFLTVLGFGRGNLQDAKMEQLADKGNGNYAYIDSFSEIRKVLGEQAGGTLVTIAKDVKIQVEFNPTQVSAWRLVGYENRVLAARDFADDTKDAGEIGAGHTVTALYEVVPAGIATAAEVAPLRYQGGRGVTDAADSGELLTVKLRYKAPDGDTSKLLSFPVTDTGGRFANASTDTRWAAAMAGFGMLLRDSPNRGELDWAWVRDTAREALGEDRGGYRAEALSLIEKARKFGGA